ncbi:hypothetical protein [Streptomyces sp. NPDC004376]
MGLAVACANTFVGLAVQDLWRWVKQRFAALFGRGAGRTRGEVSPEVDNAPVLAAMNDCWSRRSDGQQMTAIFLRDPSGVGSEAALRRWLRSQQNALPQRLLQADLSSDGRPFAVGPEPVLERWLNELGAPCEDHVAGLDRKAAEVGRLMRTQPMAVCLENVTRLDQVRPLLPASSGCVLLMTGPEVPPRLESLLGLELIDVRPSGATDSFHVLDRKYAGLVPGAARLYRRLGVMSYVDFRMDAVFALMPDEEPTVARDALDGLISAQLVKPETDGGYRIPHLVRGHAALVAVREMTDAQWKEVAGWIVRHYLSLAESGEAALSSRWRHDPMDVYATYTRFAPVREAFVERHLCRCRAGLLSAVVLAFQVGMDDEAWRLCQGLWSFYLRTASHTEWIQSHEIGLAAARRRGDPMAEARMHFQLGFAHLDRWNVEEGDASRAREQFEEALRLVRRDAPDRSEAERRTESSTLEGLGLLELKLKRPQAALAFLDQAFQTLGGIDHRRGRALLWYHRAAAYTALRRHEAAESSLQEARVGFAELGDGKDMALNIGKCWLRYAEDRRVCGQLREAVVAADSAVKELPKAESEYSLAAAHLLRGDLYCALGDALRATVDWESARDLFAKVRSRRADEAQDRLDGSRRSSEFA